MGNIRFSYEYKQKERRNGNSFVFVRDMGENALLEVEKKGNTVEIVTSCWNFKTTKFSHPLELFEKMYNDIIQSNNKIKSLL